MQGTQNSLLRFTTGQEYALVVVGAVGTSAGRCLAGKRGAGQSLVRLEVGCWVGKLSGHGFSCAELYDENRRWTDFRLP